VIVHTFTKTRLTSVTIQIGSVPGSPSKFNHLFTGTLQTFPENFVQIHSKVLAQRDRQTDRQTERQTNNNVYISSLAEVMSKNKNIK